MAATGSMMEVLESRIKLIEDHVFGSERNQTDDTENAELVTSLCGVKQSLAGLSAGKERVQALWKRLDELNSNLDPELANKMTLSEDAKADIILAEEEQLKTVAGLLERLQTMKGTMDSEHTKGTPASQDKLQPLVTLQVEQKEHSDRQSQEVVQLLEAYNKIVSLVSQQFVQWDAVMTRYEIAKKVREPKEFY